MTTQLMQRPTQRIEPTRRTSEPRQKVSASELKSVEREHAILHDAANKGSRLKAPTTRQAQSKFQAATGKSLLAKVQTAPQFQDVAPTRTQTESGFNLSLPVLFLLSGYLVGAALVVIFGLDVLLGVPLSRVSLVFDIGFLFCGAALLYLSWDARDGCRYA